jgi:aryl-alcohol dehydrogenase-like predicted oxidoreductase/predicted dehydrogenase
MEKVVHWGILGPGKIANRFADQLRLSQTGVLAAIAGRNAERVRAFAERWSVARTYLAFEELLEDSAVEAVYIATPHRLHANWAIKAMDAGKHVLCEKPMAVNHGSAMAMAEAAHRNGVVFLEAYMHLFHPQIDVLLQLLRDGAIGEVQHIDASFSFVGKDKTSAIFDESRAGGGILDVGGYPASITRVIVDAVLGRPSEPITVTAKGNLDQNVDQWSCASLVFDDGITATLRCGICLLDAEKVIVRGSKGFLRLETPWVVEPEQQPVITVSQLGKPVKEISCPAGSSYAGEADAVAHAMVRSTEVTRLTSADSLATMHVLDRWRTAIGLRYSFEAEDANIPTVSGEPLSVRENSMTYGEIPGLSKRVSRLIMGCDNQPNLAHASAMFDDFIERGGTTFDTAYIYGGGLHEEQLGQWVANRGIRESVVIISKGASRPNCNPEALTRQLGESLARLQTDHVDIYMMHRDNETIPVGEFVEVLNEHMRAGRIRVFGGSNWSAERFDEANEYARLHGLQGFGVLSNHFGLAESQDVQWIGSRHMTDRASKQWLRQRRIPLLSWSSQSRGFFTGRARPDDFSDQEMVRCYYNEPNFERLRRAEQLAAELGVAPTAIALAFVLNQPFPTFALFGPRSITETRVSMAALSIHLTESQLNWLDLVSER